MNARQIIEAESPKKALRQAPLNAFSPRAVIICPIQGQEEDYVCSEEGMGREAGDYMAYSLFLVYQAQLGSRAMEFEALPPEHVKAAAALFPDLPIYGAHDLYYLELKQWLEEKGIQIIEACYDWEGKWA